MFFHRKLRLAVFCLLKIEKTVMGLTVFLVVYGRKKSC